ncbi:hypothetical protein FS842_004360 [Serendipita sp. 407]|nr:hypothetical protein FS842_004360 [Serendipita sp. 407]
MSKISTVNSQRNSNINAGSAWARGPPASSISTSSTSQPSPSQAQPSPTTPNPSNQPNTPRTNGQPTHSRRSSTVLSNNLQQPPATVKDPVALGKNVVSPIPARPNNVQFGSIDDVNATLSTSPAAPSTIADPKQVRTFGSISTSGNEPTASPSSLTKPAGPQRTDSPAPAGKPKKKFDVNSLFQKPQATSASATTQTQSAAPAPPPSIATTPPNPVVPPTPKQQNAAIPPQVSQDVRPTPKPQGSYDSPSMRNVPLPIVNHPPNQVPAPMQQPGTGHPPFHYTPSSSHLRQGTNNNPAINPPRSPNISRPMTNGNMRGPPGAPGPGVLGSPRMGPPPSTTPAPPPTVPTPVAGMPPNMMNMPNGPGAHPPHMHTPVAPIPPTHPAMGMPPGGAMWYYYPHYDPNIQQAYYWPPHPSQMPPGMPPPGVTPQQPGIPLPQSGLPTPSAAPMGMPMSPRVAPAGPAQPTPQTPSTTHSSLAQAPAGSRSSMIAKRPITIKSATGEELDLSKLRTPKPDESAPAKKDDAERRPVSVRMETEDAHRKRIEEEKQKERERLRKDEELARVKAKRDAEARERAKRDQEEKERRRREIEEADRKKTEEEERAKREALEAEQREKDRIKHEEEERLRKIEEEKERQRIEAEEQEKARRKAEEEEAARVKAEEEARKKLEEEARRKEEEERRRKEEEELKRKEEEEAKRKEEEEARKREEDAKRKAEEEQAKAKEEAAQKAKEEEEARLKEKEAIAAPIPTEVIPAESQSSTPLGSTPAYASPAHSTISLPRSALPPSLDPKRRPIPGRLDLSSTTSANLPQPLPSALASARIIEDIGKVSYPEGIKAPSSELNVNAASGKFRYDRDFLMQFMKVCKEKPDDMPSLDAIGLEPSEQQGNFRNPRGRPSTQGGTPSRNSAGLGLTGQGGIPFGGGKSFGGGNMGQFQPPPGRSSEERFAASAPRPSGSVQFPRQALGRTNSTTGPPVPGPGNRRDTPQRTPSMRGKQRTDSKAGQLPPSALQTFTTPEPDLHHAANAWSNQRKPGGLDQNSPEYVDRKVKALLNKLTMEKFDSISLQILEWANRSVNENDGRTLIQVIRLVFEKATDEATWSEMYARLCRFLMERISQDVRDEGIKNADGKPIAGGNLFRKYLLNRCQEDFERGWSAREAAVQAAASKAEDDKAAAAAAEKAGTGEEVLYSDEYYAAQKAKRRGLGLVKFIGELFKLQMLTERIMHECIKKLLSNVENPEEEEIESLCKLLTTVGQALDTPKAKSHMDIYFSRMQELANNGQISSRIQFMLLDIIELRTRKWVTRNQVAAPTTIAEVHQKAERDRQVAEREAALRQAGGRDSLRSSRKGTDYNGAPQPGADGWTTPVRAQATKAGDLSNFGKISKPTTMNFGPSSVFSKKEKRESTSSVTRASSSSNMFAALNSSEATPDAVSVGSRTANSTRPPSRKGSVDFGGEPQRRRLMLQPRTHGLMSDAGSVKDEVASTVDRSDVGDDDAASITTGQGAKPAMLLEQAKRKVKEDIKELLSIRQLEEVEGYFTALPSEFRWLIVNDLVHLAVDAKANDVKLIADVFALAAKNSWIDEEQFLRGFEADMEYLEDTSTDSPSAYGNVATILKATGLSQEAVDKLADKIIVDEDMAVTPKEKLLRKYAALTT